MLASGGGTKDGKIRTWNCNSGAIVNSVDAKSQVSNDFIFSFKLVTVLFAILFSQERELTFSPFLLSAYDDFRLRQSGGWEHA